MLLVQFQPRHVHRYGALQDLNNWEEVEESIGKFKNELQLSNFGFVRTIAPHRFIPTVLEG